MSLSNSAFRGSKSYRFGYVHRKLLNRLNQKIARRNLREYPQLAVFCFDSIGLVINLEGRYEADSLEALSEFLSDALQVDTSTTMLDVGANIGNHSVFFDKLFDRVLAFEPNPKVYNLLKLNSYGTGIIPLNYGLSDRNSTVAFSVNPSNLGASRVVSESLSVNGPIDSSAMAIELKRLDDIPEIKNEIISLIKIDVEGHELEVLQGATHVIEHFRPIIVFEQGCDAIREGSSAAIDFLRGYDYKFFTIRNNFQFGHGFLARSLSILLRLFFGFRKIIEPSSYFKKKFYEMIVAVPSSVKTKC